MSGIFDKHGHYRRIPDRTCLRCGRVLVDEDELGAYYQAPATFNAGPMEEGGPDTTLTEAAHTMRDTPTRHLPVVFDGRLVGIVASSDIIDALVSVKGRA